MGTTPRSIQSLLHTATPGFADMIERARFFERIHAALLHVLPVQAADHVRVAAYDDYRLTLHASHASWATRLRYMQPAISQALAQRMRLHIASINVRVRPVHTPTSAPARPRPISGGNRRCIRQTASYVNDPQLAAALEGLAAAGRCDD